jgi:septal ring factor EnvC (AmiA/AmiB activator)
MVSRSQRMRWVCYVAVGALAFRLLMGSVPAAAEDDQELTAQLANIRSDVQVAETNIATLKEAFAALVVKRDQLEASLRKLKDEDKGIQAKIGEMKTRIVTLSAEVEVSETRAREQQAKIQSRIKAMYINSTVSMSPVVAGRAARGDVERLSLYARKIRDLDSRLFKEASEAVAALVRSRGELEGALAADEKLREQLQKKRKDAERESVKLKGVTDELVEKQNAARESLALLQSKAKKVEDMIASLTSGDEGEEDAEDIVSPESEAPEAGSALGSKNGQATVQKTVMHPSLFEAKSLVSAPVAGEVLQGFGRSKLTNFADMVRSKGVEFSTVPNSDVFVVLGGKIVFAGMMPGYDQVVVVEHGGRSYSLYGRLGSVAVKTGDVVEKDQKIATTSSPDAKGRNFYFEVRKNGAPVNPETVLTKLSR